MTRLRDRIAEDLLLAGYSDATVATYVACAGVLARHYERPLARLSLEEVRQFLLYLRNERKLASSTRKVYAAALRFVYHEVLGRELWPRIPIPRQPSTLPQVLSRDEVAALLSQAHRIDHRAMLSTLYATGVRVSELLHLRLSDIDSKRMLVRVALGKGKKDRYTLLPPKLLELLRDYWRARRPQQWLFPGRNQERPLDRSSVQSAMRRCRVRAGIKKPATPHTLRHSFATHLFEDGYDIKIVQQLLGHKHLRTTQRYLHVSKRLLSTVRSPFESLSLDKPPTEPKPRR